MKQATIQVAGMTCRSCIRSIEGALQAEGVEAHVNFEEGTVDVRFDETKMELANINQIIKSKGYNILPKSERANHFGF